MPNLYRVDVTTDDKNEDGSFVTARYRIMARSIEAILRWCYQQNGFLNGVIGIQVSLVMENATMSKAGFVDVHLDD